MRKEGDTGLIIPNWIKNLHLPEQVSRFASLGSFAPALLQKMQEPSSQSNAVELFCLFAIGSGLAFGFQMWRLGKSPTARSDSDIVPYTPFTSEEMLGHDPVKYAQLYLADVYQKLKTGELSILQVRSILELRILDDPEKPAQYAARHEIEEGLRGFIEGYSKSINKSRKKRQN